MIKKGNILYSVFKFKCPKCHEGEFFEDSNPYHLSKIGDVKETCPACGEVLSKEPGFYYGAMYVAYALGVATFVTIFVSAYLLFPHLQMWTYILLITIGIVILGPYLYALSKMIWANMFIKYDPEAIKDANS